MKLILSFWLPFLACLVGLAAPNEKQALLASSSYSEPRVGLTSNNYDGFQMAALAYDVTETLLFHEAENRTSKDQPAPADPSPFVGFCIFLAAEETPKILQNAAQGQAFEQQGLNYIQTINNDVAEQVSIQPFTASGDLAGYNVRLDALGTDNAGNVNLYDFKSSETAGFTPNQTTGYPLLQQYGGQVVGGNGGLAYPAGTIIPPTPVTILRPGGF